MKKKYHSKASPSLVASMHKKKSSMNRGKATSTWRSDDELREMEMKRVMARREKEALAALNEAIYEEVRLEQAGNKREGSAKDSGHLQQEASRLQDRCSPMVNDVEETAPRWSLVQSVRRFCEWWK